MPTNNQEKATAINSFFISFYLWTGIGELRECAQTNLNFKSHDNDEMYAKYCEIENAARPWYGMCYILRHKWLTACLNAWQQIYLFIFFLLLFIFCYCENDGSEDCVWTFLFFSRISCTAHSSVCSILFEYDNAELEKQQSDTFNTYISNWLWMADKS